MRGMDVSLVFAMIFAIIVIGLILVFGYQQIMNIFCFNGQAQIMKSVKDLENDVQNVYNLAEGASKLYSPNIPGGSSICIINTSDPSVNEAGKWLPNPDLLPIITSKISISSANIWMNYNCGNQEQTYKIAHLRPTRLGNTGSFCVGSGEQIYIENAGDYVIASPA